jgi:hypothetical protein
MRDERRQFLRTLGVISAGVMAGCQGSESSPSEDEQTAEPTSTKTGTKTETVTTAAGETTFSLETGYESGEESQRVTVTGTVAAPGPLASVRVETDATSTEIDVDDASEYDLDAELAVTGGQKYGVTVTAVTENGGEASTDVRTDHVPIFVDPIETDRLVGAHYYPWYEMHQGHTNWTDRIVAEPVLGEYQANSERVVDQHLKWCLEHGVRWLSVSWWGPGSGSDRALGDTIVEMENFQDVQFSILFETTRFSDYDYDLDREDARQHLREDFAYLDDNYFHRDNYRTVDGRPLLFFWVSNNFQGDVEAAFDAATEPLDSDPYVLAGLPFGDPPNGYPIMDVADGITSYNPYSAREDIEKVFHDQYERGNKVMHLGSEAVGADFVPVVIPGFNDTGLPESIREDNPVLSASPERFERVCDQVAPHLADSEGVLVTSFNEWYENTQIEPGEEFGTEYLELTAEKLATGQSPGFDPTGSTLRLVFNRTVQPENSTRHLAFMAGGLTFYDGETELASFDIGNPANEPLFLRGAYGTESNDDSSWRWLGGAAAETVLFAETELSSADRAVLTGEPMRSDRISAEIYFDGEQTDRVQFGDRDGTFDDYDLSLT